MFGLCMPETCMTCTGYKKTFSKRSEIFYIDRAINY